MFYSCEVNGKLYSGKVEVEAQAEALAVFLNTDVQAWSHYINDDDAKPLFYYDAQGVKHTHHDGDN
jgi:hypothetical protein